MKSPHILRAASNVHRLRENLVSVIDAIAIQAITDEINKNVAQLYVLGRTHFHFARRQNGRAWRQKISRGYYAAYNVSRAIRLSHSGEFSTDSSDHKRIEILPDGFPNRNMYANRLAALREDRNLCDYDHSGRLRDLVLSPKEWLELVEDFIRDAKVYLMGRGVKI